MLGRYNVDIRSNKHNNDNERKKMRVYFIASFAFYVYPNRVIMSNGFRREEITRDHAAKIFRINKRIVQLFK